MEFLQKFANSLIFSLELQGTSNEGIKLEILYAAFRETGFGFRTVLIDETPNPYRDDVRYLCTFSEMHIDIYVWPISELAKKQVEYWDIAEL